MVSSLSSRLINSVAANSAISSPVINSSVINVQKVRDGFIALVALCFFCLILAAPEALAAEDKTKAAKPNANIEQVATVVSINSADAETLASLNGVGLKRAQAIVAYRKAYGEFKSVEQLVEVKGVGEAILNKNRSRLTL